MTRNQFDEKAREFDANPNVKEIALKFSKELRNAVPLTKESRLLDCGCGTGAIGMRLYQEVGSLVMMDSSKGMLGVLQEKIEKEHVPNMRIVRSEFRDAGFSPEMFDVVYSSNVLHHIEHTEDFIKDLCGVIKKGGYLCLGDLRKEPGTFHEDHTGVYHFGFDEKKLIAILERCGLENVKWKEYHVVRKPDSEGVLRDYPLFFMGATKNS